MNYLQMWHQPKAHFINSLEQFFFIGFVLLRETLKKFITGLFQIYQIDSRARHNYNKIHFLSFVVSINDPKDQFVFIKLQQNLFKLF